MTAALLLPLVPSPGTPGVPPPAPDRRRVAALVALLLTAVLVFAIPPPLARAAPVGVSPGAQRAWPVGGPSSLRGRFAAPPERWAAGHRGVDLAASPGTAVRAAAPGVVTFSGMVANRPVVTVTHPGSGNPPLRTTYLPVTGSVPVGTPVAAGEPIGELTAGSGHCASGCLHWGLLRGDRYLDPLALLGAGTARLLPLDEVPASARSAAIRPAVSGRRRAWRAVGGRTWCGSGSPGFR